MTDIRKTDLNLLVTFFTLAEELSVSRAAGRLGVSQPAVSAALKRLRQLFDDPLLVRTSNGMQLTDRAVQLKPKIQDLVAGVQNLLDDVAEFDPATAKRTITIGLNDYASLVVVPPLICAIKRRAPGINLVMLPRQNITVAREDLEAGILDFVIGIGYANALPGSLKVLRLFDDPFVTIMRKGHPLTKIGLTMENYLQQEHLVVSPQGHQRGIVDELLDQKGLSRRVSVVVPHFAVAPQIIAESDIISTLPSRIAEKYKDSYPINLIDPPFKMIQSNVTLAWHQVRDDNPVHKWIRGLFSEIFRGKKQKL